MKRLRAAAWWVRTAITGTVTVDLAAQKAELRARTAPPVEENLQLAVTTLETLLGRLLAARQQLDTKAALIIPAIGAVGGIAADRAAPNPSGLALWLGGAAIGLAVVAVLYAIGAVWPSDHSAGPRAVFTARMTDTTNHLRYGQAVADALALAVADTQRLVDTKGNRVRRSLAAGGAAVILLLLYVAAGGWQ